jgi:hypothetical protein
MDAAAERIFGFVREATTEHIRTDLRPRSDKAQNQKDLSPKGLLKNWVNSLFLSRISTISNLSCLTAAIVRRRIRVSSVPGF